MIENFILGALYGISISLSSGLFGYAVYGVVYLIKGAAKEDE